MAANATLALQQGLFQVLSNAPSLIGLLGEARIYDDVPQRATFPYVTLGHTESRDWSTGTEDGQEHVLTVHVWSRAGGKQQTHEILGTLQTLLHDQSMVLNDHHLINLRHEYTDARRDPDGSTYHGIVRYRAVTEPAA